MERRTTLAVVAVITAFETQSRARVTERAPVDSNGLQANDWSESGCPAFDGRFVAVDSVATDLAPGPISGVHLNVHDRLTGVTGWVDVNPAGEPGNSNEMLFGPTSADGRHVTFCGAAMNLLSPDTNGAGWDAFVRDRQTRIISTASVDSSGVQANGGGDFPTISADGRFVAFSSFSPDLVPDDANGLTDTLIHRPCLTLEADPPQVSAGVALTFTTWTGDASNLALLALIDIDGAPMFLPAAMGAFDANGDWTLAAAVPAGPSGHALTLQTYGFVPTGKVQASNAPLVTFQ